MPDIFKLLGNLCHKILVSQFILSLYSSGVVSLRTNNTFIIYPHSIQRVVSEILTQPNAIFGNKYEIMDLFTKAVQNGNDPMIVASQINSATYYGRNTPRSTYTTSFGSLFRFSGFPFRRKFW